MKADFFYRVSEHEYRLKIDGLHQSQQNHSEIDLILPHDDLSRDWSVPIPQSFKSLLHQRAREIRDTYDYVQLFYSGGADSHTALRAFLDSGTKIDEIIVYRKSVYDDFTTKLNDELNLSALPFLLKIKNLLPDTKITVLDFGWKQLSTYFDTEDWIHSSTPYLFPVGTHYSEVNRFFPQIYENKGKVGQVLGLEKPMIKIENGNFYAFLMDSKMFAHLPQNDADAELLVPFFISKTIPELFMKQAQMFYYGILRDALYKRTHFFFSKNDPLQRKFYKYCRYPLYNNVSNRLLAGKQLYGEYMTLKIKTMIADIATYHQDTYDRILQQAQIQDFSRWKRPGYEPHTITSRSVFLGNLDEYLSSSPEVQQKFYQDPCLFS